MKEPSMDDIENENRLYRQYIEAGGPPITIELQLVPKEETWDWVVKTKIPPRFPEHLPWATMFTSHIRRVIVRAIQPPPEQNQQPQQPT